MSQGLTRKRSLASVATASAVLAVIACIPAAGCAAPMTNANGSKVVIADARPGHTLGIFSGGTYTPLPWQRTP